MLLVHPGPASIDCDDCQKFIYDLETGQRKQVGRKGHRKPQPRPPGIPLQCGNCPKRSLAESKKIELSEKNRLAYRAWAEVKATYGKAMSERMAADGIVRQNFSIIDSVTTECERHLNAKALGKQVQGLMG